MTDLISEAINARAALDTLTYKQRKDRSIVASVIQSESSFSEALEKKLIELETHELTIELGKAAIESERLKIKDAELKKSQLIEQIIQVMDTYNLPSVQSDRFTFSLKITPPKVIGDDVSKLDKRFIRAKFEADKDAIKKALQGGEFIEGWSLSNGGLTLQIKGR